MVPGRMVLNTVTSTAIVITVTLYCMAALPTIKQLSYRFCGGQSPRAGRGRGREDS